MQAEFESNQNLISTLQVVVPQILQGSIVLDDESSIALGAVTQGVDSDVKAVDDLKMFVKDVFGKWLVKTIETISASSANFIKLTNAFLNAEGAEIDMRAMRDAASGISETDAGQATGVIEMIAKHHLCFFGPETMVNIHVAGQVEGAGEDESGTVAISVWAACVVPSLCEVVRCYEGIASEPTTMADATKLAATHLQNVRVATSNALAVKDNVLKDVALPDGSDALRISNLIDVFSQATMSRATQAARLFELAGRQAISAINALRDKPIIKHFQATIAERLLDEATRTSLLDLVQSMPAF